jgi:hypothetical protein
MPKVELQPETGKKQALADEDAIKVASVSKLFSSSLRVGKK